MIQIKVLFLSDYLPNEANAAAQIISKLLTFFTNDSIEFVVYKPGDCFCKLVEEGKSDLNSTPPKKVYYTKESQDSKSDVITKCKQFSHIGSLIQCARLIKIIINEKPDRIVFYMFTPKRMYSNICRFFAINRSLKYYNILYDTFIGCPYFDFETALKKERKIIEKSHGYFVPDFFKAEYDRIYGKNKVIAYDLPLLIQREDVIKAYGNCSTRYKFGYFGQIQSFRNKDKIDDLFKSLNWRLNVFSDKPIENTSQFDYIGSVLGEELYRAAAQAEFLVIFDNSEPFEHYLPSKVYLYVSFTKPIIVFGDNKSSAVRDFLKDYPDWYYQDINSPTDGLSEFVDRQRNRGFDLKTYSRYLRYLPEVSLKAMNKIFENKR